MSSKTKRNIWIAVVVWVLIGVVLAVVTGSSGADNSYQPQNEFKLDPWVEIMVGGIDLSITKAVLYLVLASGITVGVMTYIGKRMTDRPNRVQTAVETAYVFARDSIAGGNMDRQMSIKWFTFLCAVFLWILVSNIIGYIPLPTNTEHAIQIGSLSIPTFALYAATANISVTLVLTLVVWVSYHIEGIRAHGWKGYFKTFMPPGTPRGPGGLGYAGIFIIEVISQFVRIISLSVRLFANILAGHLLILFMGGALVILIGAAAVGVLTLPIAVVFFMFEVVLIAGLQAFIFTVLAAIYLGEATAVEH